MLLSRAFYSQTYVIKTLIRLQVTQLNENETKQPSLPHDP